MGGTRPTVGNQSSIKGVGPSAATIARIRTARCKMASTSATRSAPLLGTGNLDGRGRPPSSARARLWSPAIIGGGAIGSSLNNAMVSSRYSLARRPNRGFVRARLHRWRVHLASHWLGSPDAPSTAQDYSREGLRRLTTKPVLAWSTLRSYLALIIRRSSLPNP